MAVHSLALTEKENINISAYRVLYILLLLVQYRSLNVIELNRILYENPRIQRIYNGETLTKYVNTLREAGCEIPRSSSRNDYCYELLRNPFPLHLAPEELAVCEKLLQLLASQPDELLYQDYLDFLEQLAWSVQVDWPERQTAPPFPELAQRRRLLNTYRKYCREAFLLELQYRDQTQKGLTLEPHEVIEQGRHLYLLGREPRSQDIMSLDIDSIVSVRQLPCKNRRQMSQTTVTFSLYGRLAGNYRPYPEEKIVYRSDGEVRVKARVTEPTALMNRLLKYGPSCQVLSPATVRDAVRLRIDRLLETLDASTE